MLYNIGPDPYGTGVLLNNTTQAHTISTCWPLSLWVEVDLLLIDDGHKSCENLCKNPGSGRKVKRHDTELVGPAFKANLGYGLWVGQIGMRKYS